MNNIAIALCLIPGLTACLAIGLIYFAAINGVSRNPDAKGPINGLALFGAVFVESIFIFCLGVAFAMMFVDPSKTATQNENVKTEQIQSSKKPKH